MMLRITVAMVVGLLLAGVENARAADAKGLAGKYKVRGTNPDKSKYDADVEIEHEAGNTVKVTYKDGKKTWIGLGKLDGNTLHVTFERAKVESRAGKGEYKVNPNGNIVGEWKEGKTVWDERWVRQK